MNYIIKSLTLLSLITSMAIGIESDWSNTDNGIRARLIIDDKAEFSNETPILDVYLELENVSDVGSPKIINWDSGSIMSFALLDKDRKLVFIPPMGFSYTPGIVNQLIIPYKGTLRFMVSQRGAGIPKNARFMLDLGPMKSWYFNKDNNEDYFLLGTITLNESNGPTRNLLWHGRLAIPPMKIVVPKMAKL